MLNKILMGFFVVTCTLNAAAEEKKNWGVDFSVNSQHQEYELVDAEMQNLNFSPYFQTDNWTFSVAVPWMSIKGDYFINGSVPRVVNFCTRLQEISPSIIQRLINRGRITTEQIERCNQLSGTLDEMEESQSGVGDISLAADYVKAWGVDEAWWTSLGLEYKADNGDVENGIGSGSRDTRVSLGVGYQGEKWSNHLDVSFTRVSATDTSYEIEDYSSMSTGIAYLFWAKLTWGLDYQLEQAYLKNAEDIKYFSTYLDWSITDNIGLRLAASDYQDVAEYPQSEYAVGFHFSF